MPSAKVGWSLITLDGQAPGIEVSSLQPCESFEIGPVGAVWNEVEIPGQDRPIEQWNRGRREMASFVARFNFDILPADVFSDPGIEILNRLRVMTQKDRVLGRPPKCHFSWGTNELYCFVDSAGDVELENPDPFGRPTFVTFRIVLRILRAELDPVEVRNSELDTTVPDEFMLYTPQEGETFEDIAKKIYDHPMFAVTLRHLNKVAQPVVGKTLKLLNHSVFRFTNVDALQPAFFGLKSFSPKARAAMNGAYANRISGLGVDLPF